MGNEKNDSAQEHQMNRQNSNDEATQPVIKHRVNKANRKTYAAKFNSKVLLGLEIALRKDPEADLATVLGSRYSQQLQSSKKIRPGAARNPTLPNNDIRSHLDADDECDIIVELSPDVKRSLEHVDELPEAILDLLDDPMEIIYQGPWAASIMIFRLNEHIAAKVTHQKHTTITEYQALAYLKENVPSFPAPRLHGVVKLGSYYIQFMDFIPGLNLEKAWPQLDAIEKNNISHQIDLLFSTLRALPFPAGTPLGGIGGQGCKDARRGTRLSSEPIMDAAQFEDFIFAGSTTASSLYTRFIHRFTSTPASRIVFTHGDLRPANIMVRKGEGGSSWAISAIIDWESSGFYPEYWESVKMTNNLTQRDKFDWYEVLPASLSPHSYPIQWLADRVWDRSVENV